MSALPIGGDTPRRGVPAENEAVPGGGAWCVRETTEPESSQSELDDEIGVREETEPGSLCSSFVWLELEEAALPVGVRVRE